MKSARGFSLSNWLVTTVCISGILALEGTLKNGFSRYHKCKMVYEYFYQIVSTSY
jgi:hypothetical protein